MTDMTLTIALERYDRHIPFFMGLVTPPAGITLEPLEVGMVPPRRDGVDRHRRMLADGEFDIAEVSLAIARERELKLLFDPGHTLDERIVAEQFVV